MRRLIATALLEAGPPVIAAERGVNEFHTLFDWQASRDVALEAPLVERLIVLGVDPNNLERRGDRPLIQLLHCPVEVEPWIDLLLALPSIDSLRRDSWGRSVWDCAVQCVAIVLVPRRRSVRRSCARGARRPGPITGYNASDHLRGRVEQRVLCEP